MEKKSTKKNKRIIGKGTPTLVDEERQILENDLKNELVKSSMGIRRLVTAVAGVLFFCIIFSLAMSFTAMLRAEKRDTKIELLVREIKYYNNTVIGQVTTGPSVTTGITIDNDNAFNVSYFINKTNAIPYALSIAFNPLGIGNPYQLKLRWNIINSNLVSGFYVYKSQTRITNLTNTERYMVKENELPFISDIFAGRVFFKVQTIFVDGTLSQISEELIYDTNTKLIALGNPLGDTTADNDLFIFSDFSIIDGNGAAKRTIETVKRIEEITYQPNYHFCSTGEFVGWISNNIDDNSTRSILMLARTFGNVTSYPLNYQFLQNTTSKTISFGFSRDCNLVYFVCNCTSIYPQLFIGNLNGTSIRQITNTSILNYEGVQSNDYNNLSPLFTLDSRYIIWVQRQRNIDTLVIRDIFATSRIVQLDDTNLLTAPNGTHINSFKLTPNGRYVIYSAKQDSLVRYDLYKVLLSIPGVKSRVTPQRPVSSIDSVQLPFFITPSSEFIVYSFVTTNGYRTYYSTPIASDSSASILITQTPTLGYSFPVNIYDIISPDGTLIAFSVINATNCEIYVGSVRGRFDPFMVTSGESLVGCSISSFKWSRIEGNRYIVMHSKYDQSFAMIYVIDIYELKTTRISSNTIANGFAKQYVITDDGKNIIYIANERSNGRNELFINSIPPSSTSKLFGAVGSLTRSYTSIAISSISGLQYRLDG